jgi:hypothetical protein
MEDTPENQRSEDVRKDGCEEVKYECGEVWKQVRK